VSGDGSRFRPSGGPSPGRRELNAADEDLAAILADIIRPLGARLQRGKKQWRDVAYRRDRPHPSCRALRRMSRSVRSLRNFADHCDQADRDVCHVIRGQLRRSPFSRPLDLMQQEQQMFPVKPPMSSGAELAVLHDTPAAALSAPAGSPSCHVLRPAPDRQIALDGPRVARRLSPATPRRARGSRLGPSSRARVRLPGPAE
jgi:hypothetical protein